MHDRCRAPIEITIKDRSMRAHRLRPAWPPLSQWQSHCLCDNYNLGCHNIRYVLRYFSLKKSSFSPHYENSPFGATAKYFRGRWWWVWLRFSSIDRFWRQSSSQIDPGKEGVVSCSLTAERELTNPFPKWRCCQIVHFLLGILPSFHYINSATGLKWIYWDFFG